MCGCEAGFVDTGMVAGVLRLGTRRYSWGIRNKHTRAAKRVDVESSETCDVCGCEAGFVDTGMVAGVLRDYERGDTVGGLGTNIPVQRRELTSVGIEALALDNKGETAVGIPEMGKSRNLVYVVNGSERKNGVVN
jgi:hypothetical protein